MPYSTAAQVATHIPSAYWAPTDSSEPTTAEVTAWITETDAEIYAKLSGRYAFPIDAQYTEALLLLQSISSRLVALRVWSQVFAGQAAKSGGAASVPPELKAARTLLNNLASGEASLPGVPDLTGSSSGAGQVSHTFPPLKRTTGELNEAASTFRMDDQF